MVVIPNFEFWNEIQEMTTLELAVVCHVESTQINEVKAS